MGSTHEFIWQRRAARWGSLLIGVYCLLADWVLQPLHVRGWFQPVLAQLDSISWILSFPGYLIVQHLRIREALSPPHRVGTLTWWIIWCVNLVLWAVALRLLLRVIFPERETAEGEGEVSGAALKLCPGVGDDLDATATATISDSLEQRTTPGQSAAQRSAAPAPCSNDASSTASSAAPSTKTSRRTFLTHTARAAVACTTLAVGHSMLFETRWFEVTRRCHLIRGLHPDLAGLRVVQLTDLHHGPAMSLNYIREVIAATNALKPDLILLTGDYVHRSAAYIDPIVRELAELRASIGVVGVLGNHDWWESALLTRECFALAGIPLIDNDRVFVSSDRKFTPDESRGGLCIAGVGDYLEDRIRLDRALRDVPESMPRLLMSHNPDVVEYPPLVASRTRIDLMLSGHTHGGQIRIPLLGTPIVPSRFGSKYASGLVQGPVCPIYVSRGIGTTILPLRFRVAPEITQIEIHPAIA